MKFFGRILICRIVSPVKIRKLLSPSHNRRDTGILRTIGGIQTSQSENYAHIEIVILKVNLLMGDQRLEIE